jgi:hypothetical protein
MDWEGIPLLIRFCPDWLQSSRYGLDVAHVEVESKGRVALPITETGYRSHFTSGASVEAEGGVLAYVRAWLDHEAQSSAWLEHCAQERQLSLF